MLVRHRLSPWGSALPPYAGGEHLVDDTLERIVFQRSSNSLLVSKLLVDLVVLSMGALLHLDIDSVAGRQGPLQTYPDGKADNSGKRTVSDSRRDLDKDCM